MSQRMYGIPRSDVERAMRHYGVSYAEAERGLSEGRYPLPTRGTRLGLNSSPGSTLVAASILLSAAGLACGIAGYLKSRSA